MRAEKNVEKLIGDLADRTSANMDKRVLGDALRALEKSQKTPAASQANIWKKTTKTQICALAAAAIVIIGLLIGINIFSGSDRQGSNEITKEYDRGLDKAFVEREAKKKIDTHLRTEVKGTERKLEVELANVEQMFKAGNVDGLVAMLSEGEFESKVASANYLAQMGAVEAIEPLENLRNKYDRHDTDNVFARAVETIKNRTAVDVDKSSTAAEMLKGDTTVAAEEVSGLLATQTKTKAEDVDRSRRELGEKTAGLVMSFQAEAKEMADGYPIKGGGNSIAEVVPTSTHQSLVFYYSFYADEDPNTAVDVSGNNFNGQVHGAKYAKDKILGGAMSFDGDDDYISIPDIYLDGFTIAAWVKTPDPGSMNNRRIFMLYDEGHCYAVEGNTRGGISVGVEKMETDETTATPSEEETSTGEVRETAVSGAENRVELLSKQLLARSNWAEDAQFSDYDWRLKPETWTHITVTYDGTTGRIYRNGKLREEANITTEGFTGTAYIGGIEKHNGGFWRGMLDEVALFNQALSEEEVGQLYLMTGEMVATGPTLTEGASGNGYYFDGDGDYIDVGTVSGLGVEQTKMLWIYMDAFPLPHDVYLIDEGGNNNWIELSDSDGNGVPKVRAGFDGENYFDSDGEIQQGNWYHIAVVSRISGDVDIYINGVLDSSRSGFSATNEPEAIMIGANSGPQMVCFNGIIDEVAIFNRALADYEIHQIYQNVGRLSGNEPGLVGYWNFDADEGDIVKDSSPYHNDGKLGDM
ncbi:MAG TPA: LamG domain-containing protein [Sedimentisphaerales bacterium]|nr:LamG domain-containing protein [Sedimentisphaerales bacterium]